MAMLSGAARVTKQKKSGGSTGLNSGMTTAGAGGGSNFSSLFTQLQDQQNAANQANEARYQQGLQSFGDAFSASDSIGQSAKNNIADTLTQNNAKSLQSSITRGLGNTTIQDSLYRGNQKVADAANLAQDDANASRKINLNLAKAQFIANRNDTGPDLSMFSQLLKDAASDASDAKRDGTILPGGGGGGGGAGAGSGSPFGSGGGGGGGSGGGPAIYWPSAGGATNPTGGSPYGGAILGSPFANLGGTPGGGGLIPANPGSTPGVYPTGGSPAPLPSDMGGGSFPPIEQEYDDSTPGQGGGAPVATFTYEQWLANDPVGKTMSWLDKEMGWANGKYQQYVSQVGGSPSGGHLNV